ncbi:hypothetical protein [Polaribacter sp. Hel1_85]|uniref:hypothetical protein n=1 Tax=Polaribacter sp. Hel1_85 TaxID=1250005 RepID=UPI00052E1B9F|nr:hypothetical protein [Polaribacter sp. Hel1_85]KGL62506.1 hypothetical protein PHEL85_2300 [Polaribacter sp. Hel1_85]
METENTYKSFNDNKSIEELKYNMLQFKIRLEEEIYENKFYKTLLEASIYKSNTRNLFENIEKFKQEIDTIENEALELLKEINSHSNSITHKIECDDLSCDNFFIESHNALEEKSYKFFIKCSGLKIQLFEYIESVLIS